MPKITSLARWPMVAMRKYVVLFVLLASTQLFFWSALGQESTRIAQVTSKETPARTGSGAGAGAGTAINPTPIGISSCSGGGCHGKAIPSGTAPLTVPPTEAWRSAFTHWLSYDNHAKAFNVLREKRAQNMMVALSGQTVDEKGVRTFAVRVKEKDTGVIDLTRRAVLKDGEPWKVVLKTGESEDNLEILGPARYHPDATRESRCLACHVNPSLAFTPADPKARENVESHRLQGVGCEACHGNASSWRGSHVAWADGKGKKALYAADGMIWLNDAVDRARACAGCHIGAPPSPESPEVRNMNHDMIAAGHPRLNFEYNTYQLLETPHWIEKDRTKSDPAQKKVEINKEFHARNWLIGRAVQMEKALELLEYRTRSDAVEPTTFQGVENEAADLFAAKLTHRLDPWPELAEFNCYSCHQSLRPEFYPKQGSPKEAKATNPFARPEEKKVEEKKLEEKKLEEKKVYASREFFDKLNPPDRMLGAWLWDPLFSTARVFNRGDELEFAAKTSLLELQGKIHLRKSNRAEINTAAKKALRDWKNLSNSLRVADTLHLAKRLELLKELPTPARWDDLEQTYFGIRGLNDNTPILEIEKLLALPFTKPELRQDSPKNYDPKEARSSFETLTGK